MENIAELQWEKRVILAFADGDGHDLVEELKAVNAIIKDQHICWFVIDGNAVLSNYEGELGKAFVASAYAAYFDNDGSRVVLIGKDGTVKARQAEMELPDIFALIETMPMRRIERADQQ
jgi:hypothetical protein